MQLNTVSFGASYQPQFGNKDAQSPSKIEIPATKPISIDNFKRRSFLPKTSSSKSKKNVFHWLLR